MEEIEAEKDQLKNYANFTNILKNYKLIKKNKDIFKSLWACDGCYIIHTYGKDINIIYKGSEFCEDCFNELDKTKQNLFINNITPNCFGEACDGCAKVNFYGVDDKYSSVGVEGTMYCRDCFNAKIEKLKEEKNNASLNHSIMDLKLNE